MRSASISTEPSRRPCWSAAKLSSVTRSFPVANFGLAVSLARRLEHDAKNLPQTFPGANRALTGSFRKLLYHSGQGGIRTHETLAGPPVFKTGAFNHSATCPVARRR